MSISPSLASTVLKSAAVPAGRVDELISNATQALPSVAQEPARAIGSTDSDAVEKRTTVHPDGEEISQTIGDLLSQDAKLEIKVPDYALASGRQLKLKLYPNLFSQALEGIEGILQRPGGCAEQTISSTGAAVVNAVHVTVAGVADVVIASATAGIS